VTVAIAYARWIEERDWRTMGVLADSRLTLRDNSHLQDEPNVFIDTFLKTYELDRFCVMAMAGHNIAPPAAAEFIRPIVRLTSEVNVSRGDKPLSLWDISRFFVHYLRMIFDNLAALPERRDITNQVLLSGYYEDGVPGIVKIGFGRQVRNVAFFRCDPGQSAVVAIGDSVYTGIVTECARRIFATKGNIGALFSVMWDLSKHEGKPAQTIGGGVSFGFCQNDSATYYWPIIEFEGGLYHRGLLIGRSGDKDQPSAKMIYEHDATLLAELERAHEEQKFQSEDTPAFTCTADELLEGGYQWLRPPPAALTRRK